MFIAILALTAFVIAGVAAFTNTEKVYGSIDWEQISR